LPQQDKLFERKESELQLNDRWYIVSVDPVFDESGDLQHIVHILHDITDRKKIEENVRSQRNALSSLYSLSTLMRTAKTSKELLSVVLKEAVHLLQADDGTIMLLTSDHKHFTIVEADGLWVNYTGYKFPVTEGLCSLVLQSEEPFITADYSSEDKELHFLNQAELTGPMVLVPLKTETETIGVLEVSRRLENADRPFTKEKVDLLSAIGEIAGNALRRQSLFESAQTRLKQLQGLRNIDLAIAGSLDLNLTFNVILNEVITLLKLDAAAILLLEKNTATLRYEAGRGFYGEKFPSIVFQPGEGFAGKVVKERKALHINDLGKADSDPVQGPLLEREHFATYYAVPLVAKGRIQGVMEVYHRNVQELDEEWFEFLQALAGQTAIAIDNAELFQNMENANLDLLQAYDATIEGWAYALDLKDEETEDHSQRVTKLTLLIARKMGIKDEELVHVKRGALLHDIGKMGVPDSILLKPGPLTDEEWVVMRRHPSHAHEMLSRIDYLRPALDIPYCHHEKWNGTGYPRGLKGKEIPLPARIFAVVDVYDALTSERPYRKAWNEEEAVKYIREESGKHFDPQVVEVFLEYIQKE
jgi:putative nucleotidyltransferase with HDIG domain